MANSVDDIFNNAEESLKTAHFGLKIASGSHGQKRMMALRNAITFARPVTDILEDAKPLLGEEYSQWYDDKIEFVTEEDEVCQTLGGVRNNLLHEGKDDTYTYAKIDSMSGEEIRELAPPWADSIFIGDQYGGSGFTIELPDEEEKKFYVPIPDEMGIETGVQFKDLDTPGDAEEDVRYYVKVMAEMVAEAKGKFGDSE